jgi:putative lipoprotein
MSSHVRGFLVAYTLVPLALVAFAIGCNPGAGGKDNVPDAVLTGTVAYTESTSTSTTTTPSTVTVQLMDVSRADAPSTVVAETTFVTESGRGVPIAFRLPYERTIIDTTHTYVVRSTVTRDGAIIYRTDTAYPVITRGAPTDVSLILVGANDLADTTAGETAGVLAGTSWKLVEIAGAPALPDPPATLQFDRNGRVSGKATCNNFSGPVTLTGSAITFGMLVATKRACLDEVANEQEHKYMAALNGSERYELAGTMLTLYGKDMTHPLKFERM